MKERIKDVLENIESSLQDACSTKDLLYLVREIRDELRELVDQVEMMEKE